MLLANAVESGDEFGRQNGRDRLAQDLGARLLVHALHLGVPALDTIVEVDREDADVNRFDDILVKLLEAFKLGNLLLQPPVELCVLNGDTDVACQRFQQFHVLAREEVPVVSAAQANDCDGASASTFAVCDAAGKIVVQIKSAGAAALRFRQTQHVLRVLEEDMVVGARPIEVEEANVEGAQVGGVEVSEAMGGGQIKVPAAAGSPFALRREQDGNARHQQCLRQTFHDGIEQSTQIGLGVDATAKFNQRFTVVEAFLIEDTVNAGLNHSLQWIEDNGGQDDARDQTPGTEVRQALVDDLSNDRHDDEVETNQ